MLIILIESFFRLYFISRKPSERGSSSISVSIISLSSASLPSHVSSLYLEGCSSPLAGDVVENGGQSSFDLGISGFDSNEFHGGKVLRLVEGIGGITARK